MDIQKDFSVGNFTKPFFIHAQEVPGTDNILELRNRSRFVLTTNDKELINAISQFMKYQCRTCWTLKLHSFFITPEYVRKLQMAQF